MKKFMDDNFLLSTPTAERLYHNYAERMPIFDYHCHLSPAEIYEDKSFANLTEIWLCGDHYKWRFMRSCGVDERLITGDAADYDKYLAYAKCIGTAIGNPLYHWTHLELKSFFGIDEILNEKTAPSVWERANEVINSGGFSARKLIERSNVRYIGTTDDPADSLEYHIRLKNENSFGTKVFPTFRPDNALGIEKETFAEYIRTLGEVSGISIDSFSGLKKALEYRMDFFCEAGSKLADHSFAYVPYKEAEDEELEGVFQRALRGEAPNREQQDKYQTALMLFLAGEYAKRGWVMQLHIGAMRDNNTAMLRSIGPNTGYDSVIDGDIAVGLSKLMDALELGGNLPKTILYTLNPTHNYVLGTMLGNFQGGGVRGKIQLGSAWWFNDHIDGMREQMRTLANLGSLSAFVGMLTDSRSFLSYPRHEYFRRILCDLIGGWVENGEFCNDEDTLKEIVEGICYNNAVQYFDM